MESLEELDEATAFERTALASAAELVPTMSTGARVIDLRGVPVTGQLNVMLLVSDNLGSDQADHLREALRPLLFGAAWKTLDLLIEYALQKAKRTPKNGKYWLIGEKVKAAAAEIPPVAPFDAADLQPTWAAATQVYSSTEELRHALVHGPAMIKPDGTFEADRDKGHYTLTADEQLAVCRAAQRTIKAVLANEIKQRDLRDLNWQLDQLRAHTGQPSLGGTAADVVSEVLVTLPLVDGQVVVDVPDLLARAQAAVGPGSTLFDLVGYLDEEPHMPFVGELDSASVTTVTFPPQSPPSWLRREFRP